MWWRFMLRRIFRIYPLSVITVLLTVWFGLPGADFSPGKMGSVQLTRFGVFSNILLIQNLTFSRSNPAPLWSLPYEVQMYCVLPALFLLVTRTRRLSVILSVWFGALALAILYVQFSDRRVLDRLSVLRYAPCFVSGVLAYFLLRVGG